MQKLAKPRIVAAACAVAGEPQSILDLPLSDAERDRLSRLGQQSLYVGGHPTDLMVAAAAECLARSKFAPEDISLVITAPSLMPAHGLEIPAVTVRNQLGLKGAHTLNLSQGCNGILKALELGHDRLMARPGPSGILVVSGCAASPVTENMTHGSFFWSDGAAACIITRRPVAGFQVHGFAEVSADADWDAMQVPFDGSERMRIRVGFSSRRAQLSYIEREAAMFGQVLDDLLQQEGLTDDSLSAVAIPATGANRVPVLMAKRAALQERVVTDFSRGHMGGADLLITLAGLEAAAVENGAWVAALTASFTAQWGGILLRWTSAAD